MRVIALVLVCIINLAIESNFVFATELTVSDKGLGGISQSTKFDQKEIQGLLSGYTVKAETPSKIKDAYTLFVIIDQESRIATIQPTLSSKNIECIRVTSNKIKNALGPMIGTNYGSIYGDVVHNSCILGTEELAGHVICRAPDSKLITYVFKGKYSEPVGTFPSIVDLKKFLISEIVWLP
jgi:hypothetical protein